jgi:hypothetical protein
MAGEVDDIVQNVVLTGNEQVAEAFNKIQEAGSRAFESIEKAGEHLSTFSGLAAVLGGLAASISIVGVGLFAFTKETAESVSAMASLADQAGTTIEEVSGLRAAFAAGGVGAGEMEQAFRHMAITTQQTWAQIKQESREGADKLRGDVLSVSQATISLSEAQTKLANINRDQAVAEKSNAHSVAEARLRLAELYGQDVTQQRQSLTLRQARLALEQARSKQADDAANAENERQKAANAAEQAELSLNAARRKEQDDRKNDVTNIIEATKKLVDGDKEALKNINPSVDNLVKGIVGAAGESAHAIGSLKGDITDLSSPAPSAKQALDTLSKALSGLDDNSLKMATAARFLGRTITQDFLNVLSNPKELKEFQERVEHLGLALNDTDKNVSEKFRKSLFTLQNDIGLVADKIGTAFGPGFTHVLDALDGALTSNKDKIVGFAEEVAGKAVPVIESFIRVLSGAPDAAKDEWLTSYTDKLVEFGQAVGRLGSLFVAAAGAIVQAAGGIASALNGVFGTSLNGFDVILGLWVANIVKNFALVVQAGAIAATGVEIALAPILAVLGLVAAAIYTVQAAWGALSDAFSLQGQSSHLDAMLEGMSERLKGIAQIMTGDLKKGIETITEANKKQVEAEKSLDDVDKQIKENQSKRQRELLKETTETHEVMTEDYKAALDTQDKAHKASVDTTITDLKKLETEAHNSTEKRKSDNVDANKALQTAPEQSKTTQSSQEQPVSTTKKKPNDGSFIDDAGTRVFPGSSGNGDAIANTTFALGAQLAAKKLGVPLSDIVANVDSSSGFGRLAFDSWSKGASGLLQPGLADNRASANSGAQVIRVPPEQLTSAVIPREDPRKSQEDITAKGVERGIEAADQKRHADITNADTFNTARNGFGPTDIPPGGIENLPPTPGTFPAPPEQVPLAPELQPFKELTDIGDKLTGTFDGIGDTLKSAFDNFVSGLQKSPVEGQGLTDTSFENLKQGLDNLTNTLPTTKEQAPQSEAPPVQDLSAADEVSESFDTVSASSSNAASALDAIATAASNATSSFKSGGSGAAATVSAASGGHIRGPGTETSDSILARLSHNEFVQPAIATNYYGVGFMESIRNLRFPKFNTGGLVGLLSPQMPRFAVGGHVSVANKSGHMQHLGTVDLSTNHGSVRVAVDNSGLRQLRRAAVLKNIGSERKSSWVK